MKNRSQELLKRRSTVFEKRKVREKNEVERLFSRISESLSLLDKLVSQVERECEIYCKPTFKSRADIARRIEGLKYEIAVNLTKAKGIMDYFSQNYRKSINYVLVESIGVHFHYKIDGLIQRLNQSVSKIEGAREGEAEGEVTNEPGIEGVYKSVYYISTIIRELKSVVISQTDKIERLDVAMEYVSNSAYKSINEIESISPFGSQIKNRIISVLFCSILLLVGLSTIKAYAQSTRRTNREKRTKRENYSPLVTGEGAGFRLGIKEARHNQYFLSPYSAITHQKNK